MGRSQSGKRAGRKLKVPKVADAEQQIEAPSTEKRSRRSGRSSKASKRSKEEVVEMAFMADDGDDAPKDDAPAMSDADKAAADAAADVIDKAVEDGNFKSDFIKGDDKNDAQDMAFAKTAANARGRVHELCDDAEKLAAAMLTDALKNKGGRERCLRARMNLLNRLWKFRDIADCENDFPIEEFHAEMRVLATVQRKLNSLDSKISALMVGADDDSSDSDGNGEAQNLANLKNARQNLRYALGEGTMAA